MNRNRNWIVLHVESFVVTDGDQWLPLHIPTDIAFMPISGKAGSIVYWNTHSWPVRETCDEINALILNNQ